MKWLKRLSIVGLLLIPALAAAKSEVIRCSASHFVRQAGLEIQFSIVAFNNGDLVNPATIERITVRDFDGSVIHDSGPEVGVPHPLSSGFFPLLDITQVPPGAIYTLATSDIWGFNSIPSVILPPPGAILRTGTALSVTVKFSKNGKRDLFDVQGRRVARDRFINAGTGVASAGAERSSSGLNCFPVRDAED
jgi:hypothetical protein